MTEESARATERATFDESTKGEERGLPGYRPLTGLTGWKELNREIERRWAELYEAAQCLLTQEQALMARRQGVSLAARDLLPRGRSQSRSVLLVESAIRRDAPTHDQDGKKLSKEAREAWAQQALQESQEIKLIEEEAAKVQTTLEELDAEAQQIGPKLRLIMAALSHLDIILAKDKKGKEKQ